MAEKYAYEFGKRWNVKTPRNDIRWLVRRVHVGESFENVAIKITERTTGPEFTPAIIKECIAYAWECHKRNRALYARVMGRL